MLDRLRSRRASYDRDHQSPPPDPTLQHSPDLEYQLPRMELDRSPISRDNPFHEFPRLSSDSSSLRATDQPRLHSIDLSRREDESKAQEGQKAAPDEDRNLLSSQSDKEEDPNLVNYNSRVLLSCCVC